MAAVSFLKKWCIGILVLSCVLYAWVLSRTQSVYIGKSFYFLVCATEHVEADTLDIRLDGGAGYPLQGTGVALAVYLKAEEGLSVQTGLAEQGEEVSLIQRSVEYLYFKSRADKKNASLYTGALDTLYGFLQVLSSAITRLDKGATQQSTKRTLQSLSRLFSYHKEEYESAYPAYACLCESAEGQLKEFTADTVFVNDLRYLLCELAVGYLELAEEFSI
jgi:hypothetical protein